MTQAATWPAAFLALVLCAQVPPAQAHTSPESAGLQDEDDLASSLGDAAIQSGPSVSIATGGLQALRRAPAVASVITAEDIQRIGATTLEDALETVPGIHVSRNNQGYGALYVIRGLYSQFNPETLVLLNGMPMTMQFLGNRGNLWGGMPLDNVARIEVIRGPGSALYGADAYSGVINVITRSAAEAQGTELGLRAGNLSTRSAWSTHGGHYGPWDVEASLQWSETAGPRRTVESDAQTYWDGVFQTQSSLAPSQTNAGYNMLDGQLDLSWHPVRLRLGVMARDHQGLGTGTASAMDPNSYGKVTRHYAQLQANDLAISPDWRLSPSLSFMQAATTYPHALLIYPAGSWGGNFPNGMYGAPNTWEAQWRGALMASYSGARDHQVRLGTGIDDLNLYRTQEFKNFVLSATAPPALLGNGEIVEVSAADSFLTPHRRQVRYAYVQDEWKLARDWMLTTGLRRDLYSDVGGTTNPRVALVWDASLDVTAKLLYGRAFRAPSFTELYSVNNPVLVSNPQLKPPTIHTTEGALSWQVQPGTQLQGSIYHYTARGIIIPVGYPQTYANAGVQHGYGVELEAKQALPRQVMLSGHYAWQRGIDDATGQDAGYAPRHHLYARADWTGPYNLVCSTQVNVIAGRHRAPGDTRAPVPDYTTVDLTARTPRTASGWDLAVSVRNLFNADVREPSLYSAGGQPAVALPNDLPQARRQLWLQWTRKL